MPQGSAWERAKSLHGQLHLEYRGRAFFLIQSRKESKTRVCRLFCFRRKRTLARRDFVDDENRQMGVAGQWAAAYFMIVPPEEPFSPYGSRRRAGGRSFRMRFNTPCRGSRVGGSGRPASLSWTE